MTRIPSLPTNLYAAKVHLLLAPVALCLQGLRRGGPFRPEALGYPASYAVSPGPRLLWPHESLSVSPTGLSISPRRVFVLRSDRDTDTERFPNLLRVSLSPCRRPYPGSRMELSDCFFSTRTGLHLLCRGSASAIYPPVL